ncbi:MAG: tyrosine-type recombinase/integrase [Ignavibacteria bacterium]|jgi:integrase|nr:tyrosine-type recombinase/integrase [Ignavibacteria bacterium]MCU7502526.1 tyrosine-type recombinase/integrase [Ignavibacteria bacterium]MCU7515271.1 tyrosine-type recombinase/integrase [Ignavibacteria bacterium]
MTQKAELLIQLLSGISSGEKDNILKALTFIKDNRKDESRTLNDFRREYMTFSQDNHAEKYRRSIELSLRHLTEYFGDDKSLSEIKTKDAERFEAFLRKSAPKGFKVYHRNLKAAFNKAKDWEYISENPFDKIRLPKQQEFGSVYLDEDDLIRIVTAAKSDLLGDLFTFAFYTGCRVGEIVQIRWHSIDLESGIILIGDSELTTKSRKQRAVPICDELFGVLINLKLRGCKDDGYVFCKSNGFRFTLEYVSKKFKAVCREIGLDEKVHFHGLRHSFASNLVQRGVSIFTVKELLGHSSVSVTERYSHINTESLKNAINVFNKAA